MILFFILFVNILNLFYSVKGCATNEECISIPIHETLTGRFLFLCNADFSVMAALRSAKTALVDNTNAFERIKDGYDEGFSLFYVNSRCTLGNRSEFCCRKEIRLWMLCHTGSFQ